VSAEILVVRCGLVPYEEARSAQRRLEAARQQGSIPDVLLLLQHPPVYTRGRRSTAEELPMGREWYEMQGIEVRDTDRGGRVTYHGPGQLVAYPIVSLKPYGDDVHEYVRRMERVTISALAGYGVEAGMIEGLTGVWTRGAAPGSNAQQVDASLQADGSGPVPEARKIASIGVHVSRGVTTHGLAINVSNDLQPFEWIVPCGIEGCRVTSLSRELGHEQGLPAFADAVVANFAEVFDRTPHDTDPATLEIAPARVAETRPEESEPRASVTE
jgi:lipoyl(octanoyl) transferase